MNLTVNGVTREVNGRELAPLLDVLREDLGVTGPKACCHQGGCGACTVLVDGQPRVACVTPARRIAGRRVTTLNGLPDRDAWADRLVASGAA